ncbi:hypothetical protein DCAR_0416213 [Daucus carota subsp. sativus]|uniref:Uncharacterized protein n=1 Tax=Daucus carota subsp. sativus TaxID=79200 RepID=A0A162A997_DAUCS|nr:hypothetical protein DCAR_0416213 [Daucus carota subsp. sativus]
MRLVGLLFAVVMVHLILTTLECRALARSDIFKNHRHHEQRDSTSVAGGEGVTTSFLNSGNDLSCSNSSFNQQSICANSTGNDDKRLVPTGSNPLHNR